MHTAICSFDNRDAAQRAVNHLVEQGFARKDIHVEDRAAMDPRPASPVGTEGQQPEPPGERGPMEALGHFFVSLFGRDHPSGHAATYGRLVEQGQAVVVVDVDDPAQASRAQELLRGLEAREMNTVERQGQRLQEIVGMRPAPGRPSGATVGQSYGPSLADGGAGSLPAREGTYDTERAMASGSDNPAHAPGLRYADQKDKPGP